MFKSYERFVCLQDTVHCKDEQKTAIEKVETARKPSGSAPLRLAPVTLNAKRQGLKGSELKI